MIVKVVLNNKEQNIDRTFDYEVPEGLEDKMAVGMRVLVPFGFRNKGVEGIVVAMPQTSEFDVLKPVSKIIGKEPVCSPKTLELCLWISKKYFCSLYQAIRLTTPPGMTSGIGEKTAKFVSLAIDRDTAFEIKDELRAKNNTARARVLEALIMSDNIPLAKLIKERGGSYTAVHSLQEKGYIRVDTEQIVREAYNEKKYERTTAYTPTSEQKVVIDHLYSCIDENRHEKILLRGVTGSGKTEVFLQAIERVIKMGKNAIMLVPEISLTPQMVQRFVGRFGNRVAVIHSALSVGERFDEWSRIKKGEVNVVVGARSAIFAPMENIGIIILDEEHETSYKSETTPRYHAIEVAEKMSETENCVLLLASATPSVTEYYKAKIGVYTLLEMTKRYNEGAMPNVKIVDMRGELFDNKNRSPISLALQAEIKRNLFVGQKTILFLNRRGYSTFVSCRECGEVINCPDCSIAMTYHKKSDSLSCHYCGYTMRNVTACPECGSKYVRYFGTGTQKIEEELNNLFPDAKVLRMDTDTTFQKGGHEKILDKFKNEDADILLGTQMVTKGLDFHEVTLVGVLAADTALAVDDFRANERGFSLLTQVCGRAGRGDVPGRAIIQTYQPFNATIKFAKEHDYEAFYKNEILQRKRLNYPPFCDIIYIMVTGEDENAVKTRSEEIGDELKRCMKSDGNIFSILGPAPAPIEKIRNNYRYRILLKCKNKDDAHDILESIYELHEKNNKKTFLTIDTNPINMY
ncbi:MAG: primosomal protein N' [Clostridia bacterium]|nr:primosomal protein N' [Clostridia bacterium]